MTKKKIIIYYVAIAIALPILWLITLTPINLRDPGFFTFLIFLSVVLLFPLISKVRRVTASGRTEEEGQVYRGKTGFQDLGRGFRTFRLWLKKLRLLWIPVGLLVLYVILLLTSTPILRAKSYAALINKQEGNFTEDIAEIAINEIPLIDRDTAIRLGNKKMGEIPDLVSQFEVSPDYTQINFQNRPVRVTPLKYDDLIKWFNNRSEGLPRIVRVDMSSGEVTLQGLSSGMKYSESEPLFRNVRRHLRLRYPFDIFGRSVLEIDDEGTPYWITPILKPQVGWFKGLDVKGVILLNSLNGDTEKYDVEEVPEWVDRVYPSAMVIRQLDDNGCYQQGWLNSMFGQKGVLKTTDGYNYLAINDDVYLYSGITPVTGDSSNLGFVLVNLRTKETKFYPIASADEISARRSAEGAVQEKGYISTFPLLLNINGRPTYCMALKDDAQLVKMYALVDAQNYQTTGTGISLREAVQSYEVAQVAQETIDPSTSQSVTEMKTEEVTVKDIETVTLEGNTFYYMVFEKKPEQIFQASLMVSPRLPFIQPGAKLKITYNEKPKAGLQLIDQIEVLAKD